MADRNTSTPLAVYLLLASAAALVVGPFLPWLTATAPLGLTLSRSGVDNGGDGLVVVGIAIAIGILCVLALQGRSRRAAAIVGIVGGFGAGAIVFYDARDISSRFDAVKAESKLIVTSYGAGLYLCGIGAALAVIGGCLLLDARLSSTPPLTEHEDV